MSLAYSPATAEQLAFFLFAAGIGLHYYGYDLAAQIDYGHWEAIFIWLSLLSLHHLGDIMTGLPTHWCDVVSGGYNICLPNDGFIPTGNQHYPGGVTDILTRPLIRFRRPTRRFSKYFDFGLRRR